MSIVLSIVVPQSNARPARSFPRHHRPLRARCIAGLSDLLALSRPETGSTGRAAHPFRMPSKRRLGLARLRRNESERVGVAAKEF
jgi:hypothetical protein